LTLRGQEGNEMKVYQALARKMAALRGCEETGNAEWAEKHTDAINSIVDEKFPSGSGWDNGTAFHMDESTGEKLVFSGSFHHMNEGGMYDGWTDHTIIVRPSLEFGSDIRVTGRDRNEIKGYIGEMFSEALGQDVPEGT
jgi:hypothetical protein